MQVITILGFGRHFVAINSFDILVGRGTTMAYLQCDNLAFGFFFVYIPSVSTGSRHFDIERALNGDSRSSFFSAS